MGSFPTMDSMVTSKSANSSTTMQDAHTSGHAWWPAVECVKQLPSFKNYFFPHFYLEALLKSLQTGFSHSATCLSFDDLGVFQRIWRQPNIFPRSFLTCYEVRNPKEQILSFYLELKISEHLLHVLFPNKCQ